MSNQINDINNEALLDELRANAGAWYRNAETLEEAVEKSKKAYRPGSSRLGMARAFNFTEIAPNIFVKNADYLSEEDRKNIQDRKAKQAEDTSDEDYQQEVDNKLSHGEY